MVQGCAVDAAKGSAKRRIAAAWLRPQFPVQ